jgi:Zn-dependent protease
VFTTTEFALRLLTLVPLLLSLTVHEYAHAWSAYRLGDDTAARLGRMTLNPLAHIDLLGTIILPLFSPIPFGWAKPVPINPLQFTRRMSMRSGMVVTAAAGPIANVILAVLSTIAYGLLIRFSPQTVSHDSALRMLLSVAIQMNLALALFNMLPVPPLDGSRIADGLMPASLRSVWESFARLSPVLIIGVIFFGGRLISGPFNASVGLLDRLFAAIAF